MKYLFLAASIVWLAIAIATKLHGQPTFPKGSIAALFYGVYLALNKAEGRS